MKPNRKLEVKDAALGLKKSHPNSEKIALHNILSMTIWSLSPEVIWIQKRFQMEFNKMILLDDHIKTL